MHVKHREPDIISIISLKDWAEERELGTEQYFQKQLVSVNISDFGNLA